MEYAELRRELLAACKRLPANGLATGSTGNISARDERSGNIVIKASSVPYDTMTEEDFVVVTPYGSIVESSPGHRPSFETPTHLALYNAMQDVKTVLHTHIPAAIVLAAGRDELQSHLTPTGRRLLQRPLPVIPFVENGTDEMAEKVVAAMRGHVGVMIRNHGPFLVADSVQCVYDRTIALRDVCEVYYSMLLIGKPSLIPPSSPHHE